MKLKLKSIYLLLIGVVIFYAGCKKATTQQSSVSTVAPKVVAGQVALNVTGSLFGNTGAFDLSGGLDAPSSFATHFKGKTLQSLANPYCGYTIDTVLAYSDTLGNLNYSLAGNIKFAFSCSGNNVSGYTSIDNVTITLATADTSLTYKVAENLTVLSLNPGVDNANVSLNGTLNSSIAYQFKAGSSQSGSILYNYTFNNVIIDPNLGQIASGSANFTTQASGPYGTWSYTGKIVFLGNQMATITINGSTYNVNLDTGVVS